MSYLSGKTQGWLSTPLSLKHKSLNNNSQDSLKPNETAAAVSTQTHIMNFNLTENVAVKVSRGLDSNMVCFSLLKVNQTILILRGLAGI